MKKQTKVDHFYLFFMGPLSVRAWNRHNLSPPIRRVCVDPQEGSVVLLPAESQQRLVQLLYFLPVMSQSLMANLSRCCTAGRISAGLAASLIRIIHFRSEQQSVCVCV